MEENQPKIGKFSWTYGIILGVVGIIFNVMLMMAGMHYEQTLPIQLIGISLLAVVVLFAISQFKKANGGFLKLSEALKIGAATAVVGAIIGLVYYFLLTNVIEPDFMDKAGEIAKVKAFKDNPSLTQEQWDQGMEMQKKFAYLAYPFILIIQTILGLIAGLIGGLIMKKEQSTY
ncbi:DUF4199 domain-containing protein [Croceitalea rosinachiae]|uniref:DUF4199 domain-containing protein n=1 Tax=Croceitalea rosinachiae TaxID=3075596 RepID=A0ABU3AAG7_9FLAO|nr:DUF4199 domain-containing protein [Croceitalea sp. F388]MDT0607179.1 DUF4199 domain-containing protein [Croceitalea sp. F388]